MGLTSVITIRDLGIIVDSKLSFSAHFAHITAKAHQRAGLISRCFKSRDPPHSISHILFLVQRRFTKRLNIAHL